MRKLAILATAMLSSLAGLMVGVGANEEVALACAAGDLTYYRIDEVLQDEVVDHPSAAAATKQFLAQYANLRERPFSSSPGASDNEIRQILREADGTIKALVVVRELSDGWHAVGFSACDEFLTRDSGGPR